MTKRDPLSWVQVKPDTSEVVTPDTSEVDDDTMDVDAVERQFQRTTGIAEETVVAIDDDGVDDEHWDVDKVAAANIVNRQQNERRRSCGGRSQPYLFEKERSVVMGASYTGYQ